MSTRWLAIVLFLGLNSLPARAAGPFDGNWSGANCYEAAVTLQITNNAVVGNLTNGRQTFPIRGKIAPDGSFSSGGIKGQFTGTSFKGVYTRTAGMNAADAGKQCLVTAERK
jgi:hypothetical protein